MVPYQGNLAQYAKRRAGMQPTGQGNLGTSPSTEQTAAPDGKVAVPIPLAPPLAPIKDTGTPGPGNRIQLPDGWTKPNDNLMRTAVMVDWINEKTGERTSRTLGVSPPPGQGWKTVKEGGGQWMSSEQNVTPSVAPVMPWKPGSFADRWTQGGYGNLRQRPSGQVMTLRDAFSTLAKGGYGNFV